MTSAIRAATVHDCESIAQIHVTAWRESYPGLVPQAVLDGLSLPSRMQAWWLIFGHDSSNLIYVAEETQGCVGFVHGGQCRDETLGQDMEIYSIYLLSSAKRQGTGRKLINTLISDFLCQGLNSAGVWVLRDNHTARRFFERLGARLAAEKIDHRPGYDLIEVGYIWPNLRQSFPN